MQITAVNFSRYKLELKQQPHFFLSAVCNHQQNAIKPHFQQKEFLYLTNILFKGVRDTTECLPLSILNSPILGQHLKKIATSSKSYTKIAR